jgi:hypothetical protein
MSNTTLMVFAKAPVPGRVKTRLRAVYGAAGAARIYRRLVWRTLGNAVRAGVGEVELWCAPGPGHPFFLRCARYFGIRLRAQPRGDLGRRMDRALRRTLADGGRAMIVGADCAALTPDQMAAAANALTRAAAVFVPAEDGGYVLVGLSRPLPGVFQAMPWGSDRVMAETRRRLASRGVTWREPARAWDIDRAADVIRLRGQGGLDPLGFTPLPG